MIKSGLLLPPPLYLPVGVKSARSHSVPAGSVLFLDGYPPNGTKIYDHSGNAYDGDITGAVWERLRSGQPVLKYDGNDYVELTAPLMNFTSGDFSIFMWVKTTNLDVTNIILSRGLDNTDGYRFFISSLGRIAFNTNQDAATQSSYSADGSVVINRYYRFGVTRSGASVRLYINGADVTSTAGTHINPATSVRTVKIGIYNDKSYGGLKGQHGAITVVAAAMTPEWAAQDTAREGWLYGI